MARTRSSPVGFAAHGGQAGTASAADAWTSPSTRRADIAPSLCWRAEETNAALALRRQPRFAGGLRDHGKVGSTGAGNITGCSRAVVSSSSKVRKRMQCFSIRCLHGQVGGFLPFENRYCNIGNAIPLAYRPLRNEDGRWLAFPAACRPGVHEQGLGRGTWL